MRLLLVVMIVSLMSIPTPAKAQGCDSIDSVLGLIPGAFKTIMYYEGYRLHHHSGFKFRSEVKCNSNNIFKTLDEVLNLLCSTIDGFSGGPSNPTTDRIKTKLTSIKGKLGAINGAESKISNTDQLKSYLDDKMLGINNDTMDIAKMAPKANTKPTTSRMGEHGNGWIRLKNRNECKSVDTSAPPTKEEKAAESAAGNLGKAMEDAKEAEAWRDEAKKDFDEAFAAYNDYLTRTGITECPWVEARRVSTCHSLKAKLNLATTRLASAEANLATARATEAAAQGDMDAAMDAAKASSKTYTP